MLQELKAQSTKIEIRVRGLGLSCSRSSWSRVHGESSVLRARRNDEGFVGSQTRVRSPSSKNESKKGFAVHQVRGGWSWVGCNVT